MNRSNAETPPTNRSVVIVDDHADVRVMLRALLQHGSCDVVGEAADGAGAVDLCQMLRPDVVVVDMGLPDLTGHALITTLRRVSPRTGIVVLTGSATAARSARSIGVDQVLIKGDVDLRAVLGAIERASEVLEMTREFIADAGAVRLARRFVSDTLRSWECDAFIADVALVVSELAANAVMHAGTPFAVRLVLDSGGLRVDVSDHADAMPELRGPDEEEPGGRGLSLVVSALAAAWGIEPEPSGKTVWAYFRHHPRQLQPQPQRVVQS